MKFTIDRNTLLKPLSLAVGVVENRHTLPILSNALLRLDDQRLQIIGTDAEIEISANINVEQVEQVGETTVPAKKLLDICKSLPADQPISFECSDNKAILTSGKSRFVLVAMSTDNFPSTSIGTAQHSIELSGANLARLIDSTSFAMAQQDVRYFLNGMLWELDNECFRVVATDGHRLAMCDLKHSALDIDNKLQMIVPHKGIQELSRLIDDNMQLNIAFDKHHLRVSCDDFIFTSKLVDGAFPDYQRVLPQNTSKTVIGQRQLLKNCFSRVAILSNEKFKGVRLQITTNEMLVTANNPEQEEAEERVVIDYNGAEIEIGFNVKYLIDVFNTVDDEELQIQLSDGNSSALISGTQDAQALYVIMPMRL